ncbi:hypothetical protein LCM20_13070 [Halobacillus litoralis]|uniref:hypothetical protein n=1 Tax=Halobacillus litoralis TaxID=45668 RepID=UPI001CD22CA0|nr:hypothetical protein [Halobacillus litoralis]MCA0971531.1 hypothetical protein [Halobacillus litoralis]
MFYLLFAFFFLAYFLIGSLTDTVAMSPIAGVICIVFVCGNVYMFFKERRKK